jgi:hypothetical protein
MFDMLKNEYPLREFDIREDDFNNPGGLVRQPRPHYE